MSAPTRPDATGTTPGTIPGPSTGGPGAAAAAPGKLARQDRRIIATLLVATVVVILNETIMGVALPRLMTDLRIQASTGQWLSTAFMLTMAVVIPTTGFLLQRLSTKTVFTLAMSLFCAGTLLAAVSPGFWLLLPARIIQASGTAMMLPLLMTTILTLVPAEGRGAMMGNVSIAISVAPALGPTISGIILHFLPWRFMFVLVFPIALVALLYGRRRITQVGDQGSQRLDVLSVVLSVPAFGGIVFGLSKFGESGDGGIVLGVVAVVVGLVCLTLFVLRQRALQTGAGPLLDLRTFGYVMFRRSLGLLCVAMLGLFGVVILLPIYLQNIRRLGALETGLLLLPGGLLMGLLGPVVGRIFDRHGPKALAVTGATLLSATMFGLRTVGPTTSVWFLLGLHLVLSVGLACIFTPAFTTGLNPLPPHLYSHGSAILSTLQQVAGAAGTALLVTIMAGRMVTLENDGAAPLVAQNAGINTAFLVAGFVGLVAIVLAALLADRKPVGAPGGPRPVAH
ncbi:DHA2 family lincomycin resistance protein-like MFS transporter [Friedmanniella endophytica]|uniref:DHA2 family lincomycin resistance protein-like MFS transporter n=1 Tax=Microlunatus kandeliicorticis TaxID=1759536 RepID=A0A7W3IRH2_9ACTN|nr:DHA2 family efflux MFS transporter permease subunit [Microlunatus kandeliicorticis]MBA8793892.1 DHA2 family lincomycin resistance protein-like MFS transporter [Microlunatus kandeliicorticis]